MVASLPSLIFVPPRGLGVARVRDPLPPLPLLVLEETRELFPLGPDWGLGPYGVLETPVTSSESPLGVRPPPMIKRRSSSGKEELRRDTKPPSKLDLPADLVGY